MVWDRLLVIMVKAVINVPVSKDKDEIHCVGWCMHILAGEIMIMIFMKIILLYLLIAKIANMTLTSDM